MKMKLVLYTGKSELKVLSDTNVVYQNAFCFVSSLILGTNSLKFLDSFPVLFNQTNSR